MFYNIKMGKISLHVSYFFYYFAVRKIFIGTYSFIKPSIMMKRIVIFMAAACMAVSATAQTVVDSKASDNIYLGINGGVATKTTGVRWMHNLNPNVGLRLGRWFTPVFGLALDGTA